MCVVLWVPQITGLAACAPRARLRGTLPRVTRGLVCGAVPRKSACLLSARARARLTELSLFCMQSCACRAEPGWEEGLRLQPKVDMRWPMGACIGSAGPHPPGPRIASSLRSHDPLSPNSGNMREPGVGGGKEAQFLLPHQLPAKSRQDNEGYRFWVGNPEILGSRA